MSKGNAELLKAGSLDDASGVRAALDAGADVDASDNDRMTARMVAASPMRGDCGVGRK